MILLPTAHGEHIFFPLMPEDFVLCSVVLGLDRTSHVLYYATNCVSSPPFILYLHMYMCMCVCACVCAGMYIYVSVEDGDCWSGGQRLMSHVFLNCSFYFLRQGLPFILETLFFSLLPGQVVLDTFVSSSPVLQF